MAGRGSRFAETGIETPKPLISVDGQPMFKKALGSLSVLPEIEKRYTAIIRKSHDRTHNLGDHIRSVLPEANIVTTEESPRGALKDAYRARPHINEDEGILIMDCDISLRSPAYFDAIRKNLLGKLAFDGALMLFPSDSPKYSYARLDGDATVLETAEKRVISPYAIAGGYYVSGTEVFDQAANAVFAKPLTPERPEYYTSYLYNEIVDAGGKVIGIQGDFTSFGTPEELHAYNITQSN